MSPGSHIPSLASAKRIGGFPLWWVAVLLLTSAGTAARGHPFIALIPLAALVGGILATRMTNGGGD